MKAVYFHCKTVLFGLDYINSNHLITIVTSTWASCKIFEHTRNNFNCFTLLVPHSLDMPTLRYLGVLVFYMKLFKIIFYIYTFLWFKYLGTYKMALTFLAQNSSSKKDVETLPALSQKVFDSFSVSVLQYSQLKSWDLKQLSIQFNLKGKNNAKV